MNIAFIFPGQGSQTIGMGEDFYKYSNKARQVFESVNNILGYSITDIIFKGSIKELSITTNTQPALMATSIAILKTIEEITGKKINQLCKLVAGHSLGEYTALCAAGAISLEQATKLLELRAKSMQEASPRGEGAMAACIGIDTIKLQNILDSEIKEGVCQIANDNVEGQIVISGHKKNISRIVSILKDSSFKAIYLNVSAPFHCDLMKPSELIMNKAIEETIFKDPCVPIITNVSAKVTKNVSTIKSDLVKQICGTVRWRETMKEINDMGITDIVEIGSGNVLSGLAKKSQYEFNIHNVNSLDSMEKLLREF